MKTNKYLTVKRIFDVAAAIVLLLVLAPFFLTAAILIKATSPGPVFFRQRRLGYGGNLFGIYKFRTMIDGAANTGSGLKTAENDLRITPVGFWLRRFSLDELPQLLNIVKGDMSFIGPRPVPESHSQFQALSNPKRLSLRPGITGWAQVSGRNELDWPQKIQKDIEYAENISFLFDLKILMKTFVYVFAGKNVYSKAFVSDVEAYNEVLRNRQADECKNTPSQTRE